MEPRSQRRRRSKGPVRTVPLFLSVLALLHSTEWAAGQSSPRDLARAAHGVNDEAADELDGIQFSTQLKSEAINYPETSSEPAKSEELNFRSSFPDTTGDTSSGNGDTGMDTASVDTNTEVDEFSVQQSAEPVTSPAEPAPVPEFTFRSSYQEPSGDATTVNDGLSAAGADNFEDLAEDSSLSSLESTFVDTEDAPSDRSGRPADYKLYPDCPPHPYHNNPGSRSLQDWVIAGLKAAPFSDYPFKRNVFWCHVFPPDVYKELDQYWPPISIMHKDVKSGKSRQVSHKHADERYKTSLEQLVKLEPSKARRYPSFQKAKSVWQKVSQVLYSKAFEQALWAKMNLTKTKWNFRDFRIQTDSKGFAIGAHPDISKKIATMMFYIPTGSQAQQKKQASSYGTCLHTAAQFGKRSKVDGSTQCEKKFLYLPNVGYTFTVSKKSYHSASGGSFGLRRTIMLNWYKTVWRNSK